MRKLKFPSYEYLKSLPLYEEDEEFIKEYGKDAATPIEYKWMLFDTPVGVYGKIFYNLDDDCCLYFDVMEQGYSGMNDLACCCKKLTEIDYMEFCKKVQCFFESFYNTLDVEWCVWEQDGGSSITVEI